MSKNDNFRVLASGWPSDPVRESGICIGFCQTPIQKGYWLIGKKAQLRQVLDKHNVFTHGDIHPVPTTPYVGEV
jgi:hypothetical protein